MVWNLFESSGFSVSIYTARHKIPRAAWKRLTRVVNAQGKKQQTLGGNSDALSIFTEPTIVFWVNLINVIHKVLGK